jgi:hypothetical protein
LAVGRLEAADLEVEIACGFGIPVDDNVSCGRRVERYLGTEIGADLSGGCQRVEEDVFETEDQFALSIL